MRINTEQLEQQLARGIQPLYIVFGDEPLLALEASDRIRTAARSAGYEEREVLIADSAFRWSELALAGSAQSLFASRKLLDLRIPNGKPGGDGSTALQNYAQRPPSDTVTLIELPSVDWRSQKSAWFEALDRAGVCVEARVVTRKALPQWLAGRLRAQKQEADSETLAFISDRVEGNLMAAHQEVQKLALLFPPGKLGFREVREAVLDVARYDIFALGEVMLEADPLRMTRMLDGLKGEGAAPPLALWALTEEIRAIGILIAGTDAGTPAQVLMQQTRIRGFAHQRLIQASYRRYTLTQVEEGLRHAASIDRMIKGLAKGDVWDELLQLALRFCRTPERPARRRTAETP
jgi:DNA polymerase-3 subunit delta